MSRHEAERDGSDIKRRGNVTAQGGDSQWVTASSDNVTFVASILFAMTRLFVMQKTVNDKEAVNDKAKGGQQQYKGAHIAT